MVYAKFIEKDKNIIFHIGNNSLNFKRAKTSGGMTMATAVSIVNAINRMITWVKQNPPMYEDPNDTDYMYLISKLFTLVTSLQHNTIQKKVSFIIEFQRTPEGEEWNAVAAKKHYFTETLNAFAKDERILDIVDRYTYNIAVDNIQDGDIQDARLTSFDIYTFSVLFTFSRIFYISYLTVMDNGDYVSQVSDALFGRTNIEDDEGLIDVIYQNTVRKHYSEYIGSLDRKFKDRFVYQYLAPYIDNKLNTDKTIIEKFSVVGVNKYSLYQKVVYEMFNGIHRIVPSLPQDVVNYTETGEKKNEEKDDFDPDDETMKPEDRKFYFMKIAKYLSSTLNNILVNVIRNFKPPYSMKSEGADLGAEKDVFDARINENKENYSYLVDIKEEAVKEALSLIKSDTLIMAQSVNIYKHNLGKLMISLYLNIRYAISEPVNILTMNEYRTLILHIFDLIVEDFPKLAMGLLGKIYSSVNNAQVTLDDFKKYGEDKIPVYISANIDGALNALTHIVSNKYLYAIRIDKLVKSSEVVVRDELLEFLTVATNYFKHKETRVSKLELHTIQEDDMWDEDEVFANFN